MSPGVAFGLVSAASFGLMTTLAQIIYADGGNAISFALTRSTVAAVVTLAVCLAVRGAWRVARPGWFATAMVALGQTGMSVCYLNAVAYIPVGLAAILYYSFPIVVLLLECAERRELPGPIRVATFLAAFVGLALAIGPSFEQLDWRGIAFAAGAVASSSTMFMFVGKARRHTSSWGLCFWGNALGIIPMTLLLPAMGGPRLPENTVGIVVLLIAVGLFAVAFLTYVATLRRMAPSAAAMLFNFEPLVSIGAAMALLGERLDAAQTAGGSLVIAALFVASWRSARDRPVARP